MSSLEYQSLSIATFSSRSWYFSFHLASETLVYLELPVFALAALDSYKDPPIPTKETMPLEVTLALPSILLEGVFEHTNIYLEYRC